MKYILAVGSGKGGVGKSTVAANLAVALANSPDLELGGKVALIDVDFYGPSIPTLMGGGELQVDPTSEKFIPAYRHGVKYISIAFFLKEKDDAVIWRGPMFGKAMTQLFGDVNWGGVDVAIVDMPPGTGDAQLSLSQLVSLSGALMVTTPQEVALADVRRAINMFRKVEVPVIGLVENMAGFVLPDGSVAQIFGNGGGGELSDTYGIPLLASIPLNIPLRQGGDQGVPEALNRSSDTGKIFENLARDVYRILLETDNNSQIEVVN
ncbi:MAG TPA: P-loop NTPase [Oligoflexia bacterium]|nr:P-loop NTPase [Oligoflexia bacterium]HMP48404.1 P-loop NTPase [Oligoflexia bacterium]